MTEPMTVALVDGYSTGGQLSKLLRYNGVRCVHVKSTAQVSAYFSSSFRPGDYAVDLGYVDDENELVRRLGELQVTRIVAGTESGVTLADTLNARLGLPGNEIELVRARRDKSLMTQVVREAGLAVPSSAAFDSVEEATRWYTENIEGEAVVKPLDSAGTDNVHFCTGLEQVRAACEKVLGSSNLYGAPNRKVLLQSRVMGTEYYVNSVSSEGHHRAAEIWRYTKTLTAAGSPIYDFEEPVTADSTDGALVLDFAFRALDALGIRSSAGHTEVMLTDRGPVFIESGARLGGGTMPEVVEKLCGVSQASLFARGIMNPASLLEPVDFCQGPAAVRNVALINPVAVSHQAHDWLDRLNDLATIVGVSALPQPGASLPATVNLLTSPGYVYLAAENYADLEQDYRWLREWERHGLYGE